MFHIERRPKCTSVSHIFIQQTCCILQTSFDDTTNGAFTEAGSFPKGYDYGPEVGNVDNVVLPREEQPRILMMGLRRLPSLCLYMRCSDIFL